MATAAPGVSFHDFSAGGATGALIREKDWSATTLGPMAAWPRSLRNHVQMVLELPTAAIVFWGPQQVQLYNDGYAVIMGPRHPQHLGSTFRECWPEAYDGIYPWMERVLEKGETVSVDRTLVPLTRFGFTEEAYFTFSFSPLRDDEGKISGILQLVTEVTDAVLGDRRAKALHELSTRTAHAKNADDATRLAVDVLSRWPADLPFSLVYVVDPSDRSQVRLAGSTGLLDAARVVPAAIDLGARDARSFPEVARALELRTVVSIENAAARFGEINPGVWPEPVEKALVIPITAADQQVVVAVLVAGVSPRLELDQPYAAFLGLVSAHVGSVMAAARAFDEEKKRAEALAEIDRVKTEFFGNVSHEFRTPLTLILAPLEDALRDPSGSLGGEALEAVHRNALRLLKLVNTLLDFARIEANRLTSTFEPTDLSMLTAGLAGSFQSLLQSAGLELRVECPPISDPIEVDRAHWEKIVLNLVSNAFKFTFEGAITVRLYESGGLVHLSVTDTGTGIAEDELPRIFDRFHRVEGARARSFEGTGIGLALVKELTTHHGGTVNVESAPGRGSTFTVSIPARRSNAAGVRAPDRAGFEGTPYLLEAEQWHAPAAARRASEPAPDDGARRARILVADDNADMREYLRRILSTRWDVDLVADGAQALAAARARPPDLVVSDVMMPKLDGHGLSRELRAHPRTSHVPVVLLSARAGEEAVIEGLAVGADDYLTKPFSARELLARVHTHIELAQLRRQWSAELERANAELEAFSYSVSHDLRAPLRAIDGFSKALVERYEAELDDDARHYLARIRAGTQRMGYLIDDLLGLAKITRSAMKRERVEMSRLAREVLGELRERAPERTVEIDVADRLTARADQQLVRVLLENLLGNAWKFTSKSAGARIEVGGERREGEHVFWVRDNGAGFKMEHAKRLFTPFQRLHAQSDFEGTGIGLATVQRVVSRHAGKIWADASPGQGATFYFTLGEEA